MCKYANLRKAKRQTGFHGKRQIDKEMVKGKNT
jgi:hypothetical protein